MRNQPNMLSIKNLKKDFNNGSFVVFKDLTFEVKEGEFIVILGPSGTGKTVLLQTIAGFIRPTSGSIVQNGEEILCPSPKRYVVFQDYALFPWKTVFENVAFALEMKKISGAEKKKVVNRYLKMTGLTQFSDWHIHKLSGGMKQRVSVARALASEADLLLMDEPFSSLDSGQRERLRLELEKIWLRTNKTILFVTHDIEEALTLADRIIILGGRPAKITKEFKILQPRPRDIDSADLVKKRKKITEFIKQFKKERIKE